MKKYHFSLFFISFICVSNVFAQNTQQIPANSIVFEKLEHNFGVIKEENGNASYTFEFTNTGKTPIKLTNVQASCGCTSPTWTKEDIQPRNIGKITAVYNPKDRPGIFNKSITVTSTGTPQTIVLTIKGEVIPRTKGIQDIYPIEKGNIRMSVANVHFEKVYHDEQAKFQKVMLYNQGTKDIKINKITPLTPYITFKQPQTDIIKPKDSLKLEVGFDATKQTEWDYMGNWLNVETNDTAPTNAESIKQIYVGGNVVENFGNMTKDAKIPTVKYDRNAHDFGKIAIGKQFKTNFTITNTGNAPLIIRQVKATCGCTAGKPAKTTLYPNESTQFDATFSSVGKKAGLQNQEITIITNDPAMPKQVLKLTMDLVEEKTK